MGVVISRFDVFLAGLDPAVGHEMKKTRPCVVLSPDELNAVLRTVLIAPLTRTERSFRFRAAANFQEKAGQIALDQMRVLDHARLYRKIGRLKDEEGLEALKCLREMFRD